MKSARTPRRFVIPMGLLMVIFIAQVVACTQIAIKITPTISATSTPFPTPTISPTSVTSPTPTLTPLPYFNMQIFPDQVMQTIRDVGAGNFIHRYGWVLSALDPVSQMNLDLLKPRFARVMIALNDWVPANANANLKITAIPAYQDDRYNHATFQLLQIFKERGIQIAATTPNTPSLYFVAAQTPAGIVLYVVNQGLADTVKVTGLPDGQNSLVQSDQNGMNQSGETITVTNGIAPVKISMFSISLISPRK